MEALTSVERTLTRLDHVRIQRLLAQATGAIAAELRELLDAADPVESQAVSPTVVTMNTRVLLEDSSGGDPACLTLCYPADVDPARGHVSVLSPVGAALLGVRLGELARWRTPDGREQAARVLGVLFQPEASGDYTT
ncbi:GreA/GreB family elongation factor [Ramlibacter sp. XY19]|uniref:GreA/GreB family elongation factor n=1 Tax=Ramlibacter paludis TaxID=2908000 RepID=UPI0023D9995D|nr:GreA/GreB family elongation factor [Ramlibacter paludis]MCG2593850.1 GreA/GreB family elongation factor [Ramlibacter paludis]